MKLHSFVPGVVAICASLSASASADSLPPVYVSTEAGNTLSQCQLDTSSATATAEAAFRYNRVSLAQHDQYLKDQAIEFYIQIIAFEITHEGGSGTGSCAVSTTANLGNFTKTYDPIWRNIKWATVHYCDKVTLAVVNKFGAQNDINNQITQYVNQCISEYEQTKIAK